MLRSNFIFLITTTSTTTTEALTKLQISLWNDLICISCFFFAYTHNWLNPSKRCYHWFQQPMSERKNTLHNLAQASKTFCGHLNRLDSASINMAASALLPKFCHVQQVYWSMGITRLIIENCQGWQKKHSQANVQCFLQSDPTNASTELSGI